MHLDPIKVFKVDEHKHKLEDVLTSSYFTFWTKYLVVFSTANSGREINKTLELLKSQGKQAVLFMLVAARKVEGMKTLATKLQEQQS